MQYHKALITFLSWKHIVLFGNVLALDALVHEPVKNDNNTNELLKFFVSVRLESPVLQHQRDHKGRDHRCD